MLTLGRFSSRDSSAQSGSICRCAPVQTPACTNSRFSSASSVVSSGSGQLSPAAAARFRLSWTVLRHAAPPPDLARAHLLVGEPQHLPKLSHGQFALGRHSFLSSISTSGMPQ